MYLISVYFDSASAKRIQSLIDEVAARTGNHFMTENHVPPHLTISAVEARSADVLVPFVKGLEGKLGKGKVQIVSPGLLLPYVIYVTPVLNAYLHDLSAQVHDAVSGIPETTINKYYMPWSWLPHVTIGKTLSREQMQEAFLVVQNKFSVFEACVTEIGLAKTNPHEDVLRFSLV